MARIVFDLDGTLIDSAPDIGGIANTLLTRDGFDPLTPQQVRSFIGNGAPVFIQRMRAARGIPDARQSDLHAEFVALYNTAFGLTRLYDGVTEALQILQDAGHGLGVCTNKPHQPATKALEHFGLDAWITSLIGGDSLKVRKPDPAPLLATLNSLQDGPAIYVGDSEVDAETAERAGVPFLLFTEGYRKTAIDEITHTESFSHFGALPAIVSDLLDQL